MTDYFAKNFLSEFTRQEFLDFIVKLSDPAGRTEAEDSRWVRKFRDLAQHPKGSDLLFYPDPDMDSDEAVVEEVERYRRENGLPGFKDSNF
jgi:hypothetical protein